MVIRFQARPRAVMLVMKHVDVSLTFLLLILELRIMELDALKPKIQRPFQQGTHYTDPRGTNNLANPH